METYLVIAVPIVIIFLQFAMVNNQRKEIRDLNERLIARNHAEYVQNTTPLEEAPDIEWEQTSAWSRPKAVVRNKKIDSD